MKLNIHTLSPLAKQLLGAAVGTVVALVLYGVYDLASPYLPEISWGDDREVEEAPIHAAAPGEKWHTVIELAKKNLQNQQ